MRKRPKNASRKAKRDWQTLTARVVAGLTEVEASADLSKSRRRLGNKSYAKTSQDREPKGEARLADVDRFLHCLVLREHKSLKLDLLVGLYQR